MRSAALDVVSIPDDREAVGDGGGQFEERLAGLFDEQLDDDLRPLGQVIVERDDVHRAHPGQELERQLIDIQTQLPRRRGETILGVDVDRRSLLLGLGAVGGFLAIDLGAVAYVNNWFGPRAGLTRQAFIDGFRRVYGPHPGFRRNHAKGVAVSGYFDSNGNGREISRADAFRPGQTLVTGRFSLTGGDPFMADTLAAPLGLGLAFAFPDGTQWRTAMLNLPVFPDRSPQGFYDRLLASKTVAETGKPDPALMSTFHSEHPETAAAMAVIGQQSPTRGFADCTFRSLITFFFVNEAGARTPVRWEFVPLQAALTPLLGTTNALFDALVRQMHIGPLRWRLVLTVGEAEDPLLDATLRWPSDRRTIDAGLLTLTGIETELAGNARDINFDPLVLPNGIEPSDDPLLSARSAVYGRPTVPAPVNPSPHRSCRWTRSRHDESP